VPTQYSRDIWVRNVRRTSHSDVIYNEHDYVVAVASRDLASFMYHLNK
jgi:hypothetical protein